MVRTWTFTVIALLTLSTKEVFAHEPLYGHGPHVLYKGGFAPGIVLTGGMGFIENELELEYGLTPAWTIGAAIPSSNAGGSFMAESYSIRSKYRFYTDSAPGRMNEVAAFAGYRLAKGSDGVNALSAGVTGGREAIDWYWFASAAYTVKFTDAVLKPGNEINYDFTLGYRVNDVDYYEPDLVIFLEFLGNYQQRASAGGNSVETSGGQAWSVAPTLMFTIRNYAIRAGVEIGLANSGYVGKPETNFKVAFETHLGG